MQTLLLGKRYCALICSKAEHVKSVIEAKIVPILEEILLNANYDLRKEVQNSEMITLGGLQHFEHCASRRNLFKIHPSRQDSPW